MFLLLENAMKEKKKEMLDECDNITKNKKENITQQLEHARQIKTDLKNVKKHCTHTHAHIPTYIYFFRSFFFC